MKIIIFGGSFNPIHQQHQAMLVAAYRKIKPEMVLLVPNFQSPFKEYRSLTISEHIKMLEIIVKKYAWLKLELHELQSEKPSYTIDTINYLQKKYGTNHQYYFLLGSDQIKDLYRWKDINILKEKVTFIIAHRQGYALENEILQNYSCIFLKKTFLDVNSTKIRQGSQINYLDPKVLHYININGLYINERLEVQMNKERYIHCLNVAEMAEMLADHYQCHPKKAKIAAAYHDITKQWTQEQHIKYLKKYTPQYLNEPPATWHAITATLFLKYDLKITDKTILSAVSKHTQADIKMNCLDKIVFIADKISKERNYDAVNQFRVLAFQNLNLAFKKIFLHHYNYIVANCGKKNINPHLYQVYQKFIT